MSLRIVKTSSWHGFLVIDKPGGITSRDAVDRAQPWFPRGTRVGHTGTLDPLATGVLVLAVGAGTRLTEYVQAMDKTYRARVRLGARSDTDDADGAIEECADARAPERVAIESALQAFIGEIEQVPPAYSAAKVSGKRAYALARRGQEVNLSARRVRIHGIDVLTYEYPFVEVEVRCGKGTYIRSLARDLGEGLGCGGLIQTLRRTRVGPFENGVSLDASAEEARARMQPLATALGGREQVVLPDEVAMRFRQGQSVAQPQAAQIAAAEVAVVDASGTLAGVGQVEAATQRIRPVKVFPLGEA